MKTDFVVGDRTFPLLDKIRAKNSSDFMIKMLRIIEKQKEILLKFMS